MAAGVGVGAQAGEVPSFVFLGWTRPGVCGALPGYVLEQGERGGTQRRFVHWPRACGSLWKSSPFHSFLEVCEAPFGEWMQWMLLMGDNQ